jgi:ABC-2 type transport system ATP-binding protein
MAGEALVVLNGTAAGSELSLEGEIVPIGREGPFAHVFGADGEVSRNHARVYRHDGRLVIQDLESTNGTYLNGWRIPSPQLLNTGDRVQIGATLLELRGSVTAIRRQPPIISGVHGYQELRPAQRTSVLYVDGLRKSYGEKHVLKGFDLEIQPGEVVGLLGPNGAGKTTFVSVVAGLRPADAGSVTVNGIDALNSPREARGYMGLAPQDLGLYPTQSVRRNLMFFGEIHGLSGSLLKQRVQETAEALSLDPMFDQAAGTLSGGQKRRLHTAMAMLHQPALLMLDEPTVGADVRTRQEIVELVRKLADEGRAVCYSTHYLPEIEALGASVAMLRGGQIIARGSIAEMIAKYGASYIELKFDGEPPSLEVRGEVTREASILRIKTDDPTATVQSVMAQLGPDSARLADIEVVRPSLDSVYLALTEERYSGLQETPDVGAAQPGAPVQAAPPPAPPPPAPPVPQV